MQDTSFRLVKQGQGALPFIDYFLKRIRLCSHLEESMGSPRYVDAILLLLKNVLVERNALYAIRQWSGQFDPVLVYGGAIGDDGMARALDKLFETDRASLMFPPIGRRLTNGSGKAKDLMVPSKTSPEPLVR